MFEKSLEMAARISDLGSNTATRLWQLPETTLSNFEASLAHFANSKSNSFDRLSHFLDMCVGADF